MFRIVINAIKYYILMNKPNRIFRIHFTSIYTLMHARCNTLNTRPVSTRSKSRFWLEYFFRGKSLLTSKHRLNFVMNFANYYQKCQ